MNAVPDRLNVAQAALESDDVLGDGRARYIVLDFIHPCNECSCPLRRLHESIVFTRLRMRNRDYPIVRINVRMPAEVSPPSDHFCDNTSASCRWAFSGEILGLLK